MSYLLILRRNQDRELGLPPQEMLERFIGWTRSLQDQGVLRGVERLKPATEATTLHHGDDGLAVEGRYPSPEDVIGFYLVDVEDVAKAQALAEDCPILAAGGSVEIREVEPFQAH